VETDCIGELPGAHRSPGITQDGEQPGPGQPGQEAMALVCRSHRLHFARR
jgi:hypothetical protein